MYSSMRSALAVIAVMVEHYFPQTERWVELGSIGVRIFFVLSGFLITGILLRARDQADACQHPKGRVLRNFYIRRFLRIFPAFYAVLVITKAIGMPSMRASFWWHAAYLSNLYSYQNGSVFNSVTHLWSLSVEEQFYLVWPVLVLFLNRRWIFPVIVAAIIIGPLFRAAVLWHGADAWQASVLTPACLDTLGLGALLALLHQRESAAQNQIVLTSLGVGLLLFVVTVVGEILWPSKWWVVPLGLSVGLWGIWLIDRAYGGFGGFVGKVFAFVPLTYLGLISYGIYLIHNFVGGVASRMLRMGGADAPSQAMRAGCMFLVTVGLASLSWQFFEKPINRLKRRFPYNS